MTPELAYFHKDKCSDSSVLCILSVVFSIKDTFFHWRRMALLCFFAISMLYPLLNIQGWIKAANQWWQWQIFMQPSSFGASSYSFARACNELAKSLHHADRRKLSIERIFITSHTFLLYNLGSIIRLHFQCSKARYKRSTRTSIKEKLGFLLLAFFHLDIHTPTIHTESQISEIITHEKTHARQCHSVDVLIQRDHVYLLLVQSIYLADETGSQKKPRIHGRSPCIRARGMILKIIPKLLHLLGWHIDSYWQFIK